LKKIKKKVSELTVVQDKTTTNWKRKRDWEDALEDAKYLGEVSFPDPSPVFDLIIKSGENLKNADPLGKSDPYVEVYLGKTLLLKTKTKDDTNDPVWTDKDRNCVRVDNFNNNLYLHVWDLDPVGADFLGLAELNPVKTRSDGKDTETIPLKPRDKHDKDIKGSITVQYDYAPWKELENIRQREINANLERIEAMKHEAKNLEENEKNWIDRLNEALHPVPTHYDVYTKDIAACGICVDHHTKVFGFASDNKIEIFDTKTRTLIRSFDLEYKPLSLSFNSDGKSLAVGCTNGRIYLFKAKGDNWSDLQPEQFRKVVLTDKNIEFINCYDTNTVIASSGNQIVKATFNPNTDDWEIVKNDCDDHIVTFTHHKKDLFVGTDGYFMLHGIQDLKINSYKYAEFKGHISACTVIDSKNVLVGNTKGEYAMYSLDSSNVTTKWKHEEHRVVGLDVIQSGGKKSSSSTRKCCNYF